MAPTTESTKRKLSLLQLAAKFGDVSKACQIMGYHPDTIYEVRRASPVGGVSALVEQKLGLKLPHPVPDVEEQTLATYGAHRIANELWLQNVEDSLRELTASRRVMI